jgi:putative restriction endonuclease
LNLLTDKRLRSIPLGLRSDLQAAADEHGYRLGREEADGWFFVRSSSAPGELGLAGAGNTGPYFISVKHPGAARELDAPLAEPCCAGHAGAFVLPTELALREAIGSVYRLSISLPTLPLETFVREISHLGETETDRLEKVRVGQNIFRRALMDYWSETCPITGICDPALVRASHMRPWAECETDAQRLDAHNGLLLSSLWDAAFDAGLVTFADDGTPLPSPRLSMGAASKLGIFDAPCLEFRAEHLPYLAYHRANVWIPK